MPTTLTNGGTVLTLPDDMDWADEFAWAAVQSSRGYSVAGALLTDSAARLAGRPITLRGDPRFGWTTRTVAQTLYGWAQQPAALMTLLLRGVSYSVRFDHLAGALEVADLFPVSDPASSDRCVVTLRFITQG